MTASTSYKGIILILAGGSGAQRLYHPLNARHGKSLSRSTPADDLLFIPLCTLMLTGIPTYPGVSTAGRTVPNGSDSAR